nr:antibiotic biosynthesis monooxygenase [Propionibacterium sp.]
MLAVTRFRIPPVEQASFLEGARAASDFYATRPGCEAVELLHNLDDPELWVLVSRWADVGSYRRAYNGYEAKMILTPLLLRAIDEPGAYGRPGEVGRNIPRGV